MASGPDCLDKSDGNKRHTRQGAACAEPERLLWQSVLFTAVLDATRPDPYSDDNQRAKHDADSWLRGGGKDYREVCSLAGVDPDFIREAYIAGRISHKALKASQEGK